MYLDISRPTSWCLLLAEIISSSEFAGALDVDATEFKNNWVPYPCILFMLCRYASTISAESAHHE